MLPEISFLLMMKWGAVLAAPFWFYFNYFGGRIDLNAIFKACGLVNDADDTFGILSDKKTAYGRLVSLNVPLGLSADMIMKKETNEMLKEQITGPHGDISAQHTGIGRAVMKIYTNKLRIDYNFIDYMDIMSKLEPMEYLMGMGREGLIKYEFNDDDANMLIGGKVGSGKSVCLKSIAVQTILFKPHIKIHCGDLKAGVEFGLIKNAKQVKSYADTPNDVKSMFRNLYKDMEARYEMFREDNIVNIKKWNKKYPKQKLDYHLILLDEVADLFMGTKDTDEDVLLIAEFMRKARAAGYHAVFCTQKPTADAVPTKIKNNLGARICYAVSDLNASMTVLGETGAEKLPGSGRGYIRHSKGLELFQGLYLDDGRDEDTTGNNIESLIEKHITVKETKQYIDTSGVINHDPAGKR